MSAIRILVCGGRDYQDRAAVYYALDSACYGRNPVAIIQGGATGADTLAAEWARKECRASDLRIMTFHADWGLYGNHAGPIRNQKMIDEGKPDLVLAFPGGRGAADMVRRAEAAGIRVVKFTPSPNRSLGNGD